VRNPAYILLSLSALFWSGNFVVGRALAGAVDPLALNFWRWSLAILILWPLTYHRIKAAREILLAQWPLVLLLGATGIALFHTLVYAAVAYTSAVNTLLLVSVSPVLIVVFSWLMFRDRLTGPQALGVAVSLGGAAVLIGKGDLGTLLRLSLGTGELLATAAVVVWSLYSTLLKRRPAGLDPMALLTASVLAGTVIMLPFYALGAGALPVSGPILGGLAYIVIFASVLGFVFWSRGVAVVGPNAAGVFLHLMPLFGAVLSISLLGETIALFHLVGAALVICGILLVSHGSARRVAP